MVVKEQILSNWKYREASKPDEEWQLARNDTYGNQIHLDLLKNGEIPDPFYDQNEKLVQWVGKKDWEYKTEFRIDPNLKVHWLVFEGLDTFATIYVNGVKLLDTDNMFRTYKLDLSDKVTEEVNELRILFRSGLLEARSLEKLHGQELSCWNGEFSRLHVRKAQYHFGWDWGPLLVTCGPWKPVKLVEFEVGKLVDFDIDYSFTKEDLSEVEIEFTSKTSHLDVELTTKVEIFLEDKLVQSTTVGYKVVLQSPKLWFPYNYGPQTRYKVVATLLYQNEIVDTKTQLLGLRKTELVQEPLKDEEGKSFYFKVNNIPIFVQGCNWIPSHSFHSATTLEHYDSWLKKAKEGNFNLVRVWGGGIWEADWFYDLCDDYGILVWQDFLFACGLYPAYDSLVENIKYEIIDQLKRLKQYSSIIVYVGNNEDYQLAQSLDLKWDPQEPITEKSVFPARLIYEVVIPEVINQIYAKTPISYQYGSPYSASDDPSKYIRCEDPTVGDIHQWNVWHGTQEKYQNWDKLIGRFVSEFGMLAFPSVDTLKKYITEKELYPQSQTMDSHNKSDGFERRLALYVMENFQVKDMSLESWVYITQLMQSECLRYAYRLWRRKWGQNEDRKCGGAIVWQLNDCWPVSSWSVVDYELVPKLAFYGIKRECEPIVVGIKRNETIVREEGEPDLLKITPLHDYAPRFYDCDVWVVSSLLSDKTVDLKILVYDTESGEFKQEKTVVGVTIGVNRTQEIVENLQVLNKDVVQAQIFDGETVIHESSDWPQPLKYIRWPSTDIKTSTVPSENGSFKVEMQTNSPVKGVEVQIEPPNYDLDDNGLDMFPGTTYTITVKPKHQSGAGERKQDPVIPRISVRYLQ